MKKTQLLTVLGVLLAMGLTGCKTDKKSSAAPAGSSNQPVSATSTQKSSSAANTSSVAPTPVAVPDPDGHHFGADADVAADATLGTVAYKKATCNDNDGFERYKVNQSVVTYANGSSRKSTTPDGYTKLNGNNQSMSFKIKVDKKVMGKLFLYGCMDGWGASSNHSAGFYYQNNPNVEIKINGETVDVSGSKSGSYEQWFGADASEEDSSLSKEGYAPYGNIVLNEGVNEVVYTRKETLNMLIKDFVFIVEEFNEWGTPVEVAADATAGTVAYKKYVNNIDGRIKIEWKSLDGTFAEGSANKSGTPAGYLKLADNKQKISYKFNFDANLDGEIYQRGAMDNYSSNQDRTYFSQQKGAKYGNFEVKVNESTVYIGDKKDITYLTMLGTGTNPDTTNMAGYSEVKDCLIGDCYIKNGLNEMSFERLDSFNLAVSEFVFIGQAGNAHTAPAADAPYVTTAEDSFWQASPDAADTFKYNRSEYRWKADSTQTDTTSTCNEHGIKHEICEITGKTREVELPFADHTWIDDPDQEDVEATTCDGHGTHYEVCEVCGEHQQVDKPSSFPHSYEDKTAVQNSDGKNVVPFECSACHKVGAKMSENDYSSAEFDKDDDKAADAIRPSQGKAITYKIVVSKAGKYSLEFGMFCKSNDTIAMSQRKFAVKVNGADATVTLDGTTTPKALGMTSTNAVQIELCSEITLTEGENTIALTCASYRLHYKGNLTVYEK